MKTIHLFRFIAFVMFFASFALGVTLSNIASASFGIEGSEERSTQRVYSNEVKSIVTTQEANATQKDTIWLEKRVNKAVATIGEMVEYEIILHNEEAYDIPHLTLKDQMPMGLKYKPNTFRFNSLTQTPKLSQDGLELSYLIDTLPAKSSVSFTYLAIIGAGGSSSLTNTAWISKDNVILSNSALATTTIIDELMRNKAIIIGEVVDGSGKGVEGVRLYMQDGRYAVSDRNGKYHFENVDSGSNAVQVDVDLLPNGYEIDRCRDQNSINTPFSRLITLSKGSLKRANFCLKQGVHRTQPNTLAIPSVVENMPTYAKENLVAHSPQILWPPPSFVPAIASTSIAFSYPKDHNATLWVNDQKVSMLNFEGKTKEANASMVIDRYKGVDLLDNLNTIKVEIFDKKGKRMQILTRKIHVASTPVRARFVEKSSYLAANGMDSPVIAVKLIDNNGEPIRAGITGDITVQAPHATQNAIDALSANPLSFNTQSHDKYIVGANGIAYIKLQPTTQSGEVVIDFDFNGRKESVKAWLKPQMRDWIAVGFADGKITKSKKGEYKPEGKLSLFAKGKVKKDWLLTLGYNSGKDPNTPLFGEIDPNTYYTLYSDAARRSYEAASRKKLFVKLETDHFYLLYGDFNTDLSSSELSQYTRTMTGLKSEYHSKHIQAKAFVSKSPQAFMKDELQGNGTSGYYLLSNKMVIENSQTVTIEIRDRYQNHKIINTKRLQRFIDYDIDYALGRIAFKEPIFSTDEDFNPQFIVIDYEIDGNEGEYYTYGGRVAFKGFDEVLEVGATYVKEDNAKSQNTLLGVDTTLRLTHSTILKAQYAKTIKNTLKGEARLVELEHISKGLFLRGYYRKQDHSFGVGQLNGSLGATRKMGIEFNRLFDNRFYIQGNGYRDSSLVDNTHQDVVDIKMGIQKSLWSSFLGYRYAKNSQRVGVNQLLFGAMRSFWDQKLRLSLNYDYSLNANDTDLLYPTKTLVEAQFALSPKANLFANYEISKRENQKYTLGQIGVRYTPWSGMSIENRTLSEFYNDTARVYSAIGLKQNFQLTDSISLNFGYEEAKVAKGARVETNNTNPNQPFEAYHASINYHNKTLSATLSGEHRESLNDKRTNVTLGIYSGINDDFALAYSGGLNLVESEDLIQRDIHMKLLFAYRPNAAKLVLFDKLEYLYAKHEESGAVNKTQKLVNNLNLNYLPNDNLELALQYGIKYVFDSIEAYDHKGTTHLLGVDTSWKLNDRWDIGVQGGLLYAQSSDNYEYNAGAYLSYNLFEDAWLSLGYNIEGFEDEDFELQNYRKEGAYVQFKMKFNQKNLSNALKVLSW